MIKFGYFYTMRQWQTFTLLAVSSILSTARPVHAQFAVPKDGPCPPGYYTSGNYCAPRSNATHAMFKNGPCPSGYFTSGKYCVSRK